MIATETILDKCNRDILMHWTSTGKACFDICLRQHFPHMVVCYALAAISLDTCMRPAEQKRVKKSSIKKVRVLSLAFCASVACGNIALKYIYVSFAQMVTAAGPLFTIMLMYVMTGKRYSKEAYAAMVPMCGGVMMCTAGEVNFHWLGFLAVVAATWLRGVKSIIQGRLLTEPEDKFDSLTLLFYMSQESIVPLGVYVALFEHGWVFDPALWNPMAGAYKRWALVFASGVVAFALNLCNFIVTKQTSAVTLQVLGNIKVVISIGVSLLIFGNPISSWSAAGCVITLAGVYAYNKAPKA